MVQVGLSMVQVGLRRVQVGLRTVQMGLSTVQVGLSTVQAGVSTVQVGVSTVKMGVSRIWTGKKKGPPRLAALCRNGNAGEADQARTRARVRNSMPLMSAYCWDWAPNTDFT